MKIGIIIGSVRDERLGDHIAEWVAQQAQAHPEATFEIIDLKAFDLPLLTTSILPRMNNKHYDDPHVAKFSQTIDACDGFVFVTPEYNGSVSGAFKNAVDHLAAEWAEKPVMFVGYAYSGAHTAIEHWRTIVSKLQAPAVDEHVSVSLNDSVVEGVFQPTEANNADVATALAALVAQAG